MEDEVDLSCFVPGMPVSFQQSYFYYLNWLSPVTLLLSIWCFFSNASVIIALFRTGVNSIRSGLLLLCSLTFTDLVWGAIVAPVFCWFRIKQLLNRQVCEVYSELEETPVLTPVVAATILGTFGNLAIISIDRYLAVKKPVRYKYLVTRRRALAACSVVWLTSLVSCILAQVRVLETNHFHFFAFGFIVLTTAVIFIAQVMTLLVLRRHNKAIAQNMEKGNQVNPSQANPHQANRSQAYLR